MDLSLANTLWTLVLTAFGYLLYEVVKISLRPQLSTLRHLPGPKNDQFLVGQALRILRAPGPNDLYLQWMRRWPNAPFIRCVSWLNSEVLLVNNLEACREVLQTNASSFVKPAFFYTLVGEMLGKGLLFSVGDEHKRLRRIVAGPLSKPSVRKLFPVFFAQSKKMVKEFEDSLKEGEEAIIEVDDIFTRTTLNIIGMSLLGKELHDFRSSPTSLTFEECYQRMLAQPIAGQIISFVNPFIPLRWLPVAANLNFVRAKATLKSMMVELIEKRTSEVLAAKNDDTSVSLSDDLLTRMIEASIAEEQKLSKQELIDLTMQVIAAGHETSAGALTWTIYALASNPDIQHRLRKEVLGLEEAAISAKSIDDLLYLNNVIRESLRVYSPSLMAPWEAGEDMTIAGVHIPKGTTVQTVPAMIQLNPTIWGDDAEDFNPDRWDSLNSNAASPYAMELFLNGPRMCPGKGLAMLEMKVLLMEIIKRFHLDLADDKELEFTNPSLTLKSKRPLQFKILRV
ncbi:hypothetical protein FSARC_1858 [Fusarium sarcochroum]|uniref:Cytochrome P450 n=1 Tax=Fusarium sarcochroum TaxID=1208366 RepID=A0A8H4U884_9HYPO|nr:hypothetical protein FSARC_1858 [Fusarium sarcochroum]